MASRLYNLPPRIRSRAEEFVWPSWLVPSDTRKIQVSGILMDLDMACGGDGQTLSNALKSDQELLKAYRSMLDIFRYCTGSLSVKIDPFPQKTAQSALSSGFKRFRIQPLEMYKFAEVVKPLDITLRFIDWPGSFFVLQRVIVRVGGGWKNLEEVFAKLESEQQARIINKARRFTGRSHIEDFERAEEYIALEITRRVNEQLLSEIDPIPALLTSLPAELRALVYQFAIHKTETVHPFKYSNSPVWPFRHDEHERPKATSLLLANKRLYSEVIEVLYRVPTFHFTLPCDLSRWIECLQPSTRQHIRKLEFHFESNVSLLFFQDGLDFDFRKESNFVDGALSRFYAKDFMDIMGAQSQHAFKLTVRLPWLWRMDYSRFAPNSCHVKLCRWLVKAVCTMMADSKNIKVEFETAYYRGEPDLSDKQMGQLRFIQRHHEFISWEMLDAAPGETYRSPPTCTHSRRRPYA